MTETPTAEHDFYCMCSAEASAEENLRDMNGTDPTMRQIEDEARRYLADGIVECVCS